MPFALSLLGGVAWALLVVGATYVLGRITDDVIEPAFSEGVEASTVWWAVGALILVAVLRGLSVVVRRWYGSVTETRMQASLRRRVGERLLTMPMSSYRKHPTGQLLANADVDITTGTQLLMPLPFSIGVIALVAVSLVSLFTADVWFAVVALVLFPALAFLSRYYTNKVNGPAAVRCRHAWARSPRSPTRASTVPSRSRRWDARTPRTPGSRLLHPSCAPTASWSRG